MELEKKRPSLLFKKVVNRIPLPLIVIFAVIAFVFSPMSAMVSAFEPGPRCESGGIYGGGIESAFRIILDCQNLDRFSNSGNAVADSYDLTRIKLHPFSSAINPFEAKITGSQLELRFHASDGSRNREITIEEGALLSSIGVPNLIASLDTESIIDHATPNVVEDYYEISGVQLNIKTDFGLLSNDSDAETSVHNATVVTQPQNGILNLNIDGSFTYNVVTLGQVDTFTYQASDLSGNFNTARVIINDAAPTIIGRIYRQGPILNNGFAKIGDIVRLDFKSNEPIYVDKIVISKHVITDVMTDDNLNFYALYKIQPDDYEGMNLYSITAHDRVGNVSTVTSEKGIIFDKTAPDVSIDDIDDGTVGDKVIITGTIDDTTSYLSLGIDGKGRFVPTLDTDGQNWTYVYDTAKLSPGNHIIQIIATDLSGNFSQYSTNLKLKKNPHNINFVEPEAVIQSLDNISPPVAIMPQSYQPEILGVQSPPSVDKEPSVIMPKKSNENNHVDVWYWWLLIPFVAILIGLFIRPKFIR